MHRHRDVGFLACVPEDIPLAGVHRGAAEFRRILGEGDGVAALRRTATDFLGGEHGVPERNERQRDELASAGSAAPVVDDPVVVDLQALERELLVLTLRNLPAEAGEDVGVVDRSRDMVELHVFQPLTLAVGARSQILVDSGHVALLFSRHASGAMQEAGGRHQVVVEPHVTQVTVRVVAFESVMTALELQTDLFLNGPRTAVTLARRKLLLPQVAGSMT